MPSAAPHSIPTFPFITTSPTTTTTFRSLGPPATRKPYSTAPACTRPLSKHHRALLTAQHYHHHLKSINTLDLTYLRHIPRLPERGGTQEHHLHYRRRKMVNVLKLLRGSQSKLSSQELGDLQKATHFDKKELQQWYKGKTQSTISLNDTAQRLALWRIVSPAKEEKLTRRGMHQARRALSLPPAPSPRCCAQPLVQAHPANQFIANTHT